mgnify:CR=1 FL=1
MEPIDGKGSRPLGRADLITLAVVGVLVLLVTGVLVAVLF